MAIAALGREIRSAFAEPLYEGPGGETIDIRLPTPERMGMLRLMEDIRYSQRVEAFEAELSLHGSPVAAFRGTTIGYQRLLPLHQALADHVRVRVTGSRGEPMLSMIGLYRA